MRRYLAIVALAFAAAALLAPLGASAGAATVRPQAPQFRMLPAGLAGSKHYLWGRQLAHEPPSCGATCDLKYGGGPVLTTPHAYVIFWDFRYEGQGVSDPDGIARLMRRYFGNLGGSAYANVVTQYYQISGGNKQYIGNPSGQASFWDDTQDPIPAHPTDSQIQQEALSGVAHFGYDPSGSYIVISAHHHDPQGFGPPNWCAYNGAFNSSSGVVAYVNLPYMPDAGKYCGANIVSPPPDESGTDEGQTIVAGALYEASVTDAEPVSGWYSGLHGEIYGACAWQDVQSDPFGSFTFTQVALWSNAAAGCVHS